MAFNVISNITLDMKHAYSVSNIVQVNQYDTAGVIKAQLLNDGAKWSVPQGAKPVVMFKKTDNIGGFYDVTDTDPETAAVSIDTDRSIIYISLDPQTTTTATSNGKYVDMQVAFFENGLRISTFAFYMQVLPSVITSGDLLGSSWIFNILSKEIADTLTVATTPQAMTDWLEENITQETGYVIDNTLTVAGAASDAEATGKMVVVSDQNPNRTANKVWVKKTPSEVQIPTVEELDEVKSALNAKYDSAASVIPELLNISGVLKLSGYSDNNNRHTNFAMPFIPDFIISGVFITKIKLNVNTPGIISFGYYPTNNLVSGSVFDRAKHRIVNSFKISSSGVQEIIFSPPMYIPDGNTLAVGDKDNDTLSFNYGSGFDTGFYAINTTSDEIGHSTRSLGINVYGIDNLLNETCFLQLVNSMIKYKNSVIIDGYDSRNGTVSVAGGIYFPEPLVQNTVITGIKINVQNTGTISFAIYKNNNIGAGVDYVDDFYKRCIVCDITTVGEQVITFDSPIYVPRDCVFCIGSKTDTVGVVYGTNGVNKGFLYRNSTTNKFGRSTRSIGVTIYSTNSEVINVKSIKAGKKISIYGDSISTFSGWIPEGNAVYYTGSNAGVSTVYDTWWMKTINALDLELLVNNSWSGRTVSSIKGDADVSAGYKEENVVQLKSNNILPDIIIIKLGINDFDYECPLGNYDGGTELPSDPSTFTNAYAMMLNLIMTNFPLSEVYCCTLQAAERNGSIGFPEINGNGESLTSWNNAIKQLASAFGAKIIDHEVCGITYYNLKTYMGDWAEATGAGLHPNAAGHSLIANQTIHDIDNAVRARF